MNDALKRAYGSRYEQARGDRSLRMQANCILYSIRRREIWAFGDCCCRLWGKIYSHKKRVDAVVEQARALYLELALLRGETEESLMRNDPGRAFIMPLLEQQYLLANGVGPFAYPVLDGFPIHPEQTVVYRAGRGGRAGERRLPAPLTNDREERGGIAAHPEGGPALHAGISVDKGKAAGRRFL